MAVKGFAGEMADYAACFCKLRQELSRLRQYGRIYREVATIDKPPQGHPKGAITIKN